MKIAIVGIGLMGGSMALALRDNALASEIIGVDNSEKNIEKALELGLIDRALTLDQAIETVDVIVLATPVDTLPMLAIKVLNKLTDSQIVFDMGSTKQEICELVSQHPRRSQFVATHPMWGTENSGPESAVKGAFRGRTLVICEKELSNPEAVQQIEKIYSTLGMPIKYMPAEEHDIHAAYVSHISHITSFALALTVLEKEREQEQIFDLAGGGFESTVRLAKSSPQMWVPIFMKNKYNVLDVLREHIHQLQIIRRLLEKDDMEGLYKVITKANRIKEIIKG